MGKAEVKYTTPDNPLEMHQEEAQRTIGWLLHLRRRMLSHHRVLEMDRTLERDVAIACLGELLKFAGRDRVLRPLLRPLSAVAYALEDGTPGSLAPYLKAPAAVAAGAARPVGSPPRDSRKRLRGVVAFLVETLIGGGVFTATDAAETVADAMNDAGCRMPNGGKFKDTTVTDWHEHVIYHALHTDLEHEVMEVLKQDLKLRHPEHMGWDRPRLELWLAEVSGAPAAIWKKAM